MHLQSQRFIFFLEYVIRRGFWKRESRPIWWHQCRLFTRNFFFCLHMSSLWRTRSNILPNERATCFIAGYESGGGSCIRSDVHPDPGSGHVDVDASGKCWRRGRVGGSSRWGHTLGSTARSPHAGTPTERHPIARTSPYLNYGSIDQWSSFCLLTFTVASWDQWTDMMYISYRVFSRNGSLIISCCPRVVLVLLDNKAGVKWLFYTLSTFQKVES
jgi:hypothetical protein